MSDTDTNQMKERPTDPAEILDSQAQLEAFRALVQAGGGQKGVEEQHAKGKLTSRERLAKLLDADSFVELDSYLVHKCHDFGMEKKQYLGDGVVTGHGKIDDRPAFVSSEDFTVIGGSLGAQHAEKIVRAQRRARQTGVPFIQLNDSGGARIQEGVESLEGYGRIFFENTAASGVIPQISLILGPCAGGAVYSPAITDFTIMVDRISNMFVTGPSVVKAVTGEAVSVEELGGARVHNQISGVAHFLAADESDAFRIVRRLLSFIPSNNKEMPPQGQSEDRPERETFELEELIPEDPRKTFDMRDVIITLVDDRDFFEVQPHFAENLIVGFGRLANHPIGIVANQPKVLAGVLDINAADKASRFIRFCDAFNIPVVTVVDVPGFLPGTSQEHGGLIRHGAKLLYAYAEATVPKLSLIVRKAFGGAFIALASRGIGHDCIMALPSAEIAVMGAEGAANIIFRHDIEAAVDSQRETVREAKIDEFRRKFSRPYLAGKQGLIDMIIAPNEARWMLIRALDMTIRQRKERPDRKHGNIPL
jgi:acetyl-CoA carboxylase carboxyltransferase component